MILRVDCIAKHNRFSAICFKSPMDHVRHGQPKKHRRLDDVVNSALARLDWCSRRKDSFTFSYFLYGAIELALWSKQYVVRGVHNDLYSPTRRADALDDSLIWLISLHDLEALLMPKHNHRVPCCHVKRMSSLLDSNLRSRNSARGDVFELSRRSSGDFLTVPTSSSDSSCLTHRKSIDPAKSVHIAFPPTACLRWTNVATPQDGCAVMNDGDAVLFASIVKTFSGPCGWLAERGDAVRVGHDDPRGFSKDLSRLDLPPRCMRTVRS